MKKLIKLMLALVLVLSLVAMVSCGDENSNDPTENPEGFETPWVDYVP